MWRERLLLPNLKEELICSDGDWSPVRGAVCDDELNAIISFTHPYSNSRGRFWNNNVASFKSIKLSNHLNVHDEKVKLIFSTKNYDIILQLVVMLLKIIPCF